MQERDCRTRESQAGFRPGRGCVDQIFALHQVLELRHEYRQSTNVAFLDFSAAFDSVDRTCIVQLMENDGVPSKICRIITAMYKCTTCEISVYNTRTVPFNIKSGVRQGGILSPFLFNYCIDYILNRAMDNPSYGVTIHSSKYQLTDLTFADDIALLSSSSTTLQEMVNQIKTEAAKVGLVLSSAKSKYMCTDDAQRGIVSIDNVHLEKVDWFTYLGSRIGPSGACENEINARI